MDMQNLLEELVKKMVDNPEAVAVVQRTTPAGDTELEIVVADADVGKVLGRDGATFNAIKQLVKVATVPSGKKDHKWVYVVLRDPRDSDRTDRQRSGSQSHDGMRRSDR